MKTCGECGGLARDEAKFCSQCGKSVIVDAEGAISWQIEIPLMTNRFILQNVGLGLLLLMISLFAIFGIVFGFTNGLKGVGQGLLVSLIAGAFFALISVFTLLIFLGNKYCLEFRVGNDGIFMVSRQARAHAVHRLALIAGLLARNPAVMGAGLAGTASETAEISWKKVKSFRLYPDKKVVAVHQGFLPALYVYCTADNFKLVSDKIAEKSGKHNQ
ncbi:MAG: hypothetical protein HZC17_01820 [Candidatus Omnitrophica bacterium]|nr:hypothetical protein [Candidatus Omnitrophota bacterium]